MQRAIAVVSLVLLAGCPVEAPPPNQLSSFKVQVLGVYQQSSGGRVPVAVSSDCLALYNNDPAQVPAEVKGTAGCRYVIPRGEVEFDLVADALGIDNKPYADFNGTVSFRVIPGDLMPDLRSRWTSATLGHVEATVHALHPYGEVRVWVEDSPPKLVFDGGVLPSDQLPPEPAPPARRTFAAGSSQIVYFGDQTLQSLQQPAELDNRSSPFAGEFVVVGKNPSSGSTLKQTCSDDPSRNGRDALMVVTGLDPSGFFVTDISACRLREQLSDALGNTVRTAEPSEPCYLSAADGGRELNFDGGMGVCPISQKVCRRQLDCFGYLPGTYASMFIYNYNFPDGLDEGDLLFTLSGSVQEFTSTTQMVFPAWTVAERVRRLPQEQWNKWLQFARPYELNARVCGQDNAADPFLTDALCGHNRRNMKMESLESALVKVRRARFPKTFENCDFNADGQVPFFCENPNPEWHWDSCGDTETDNDRAERTCTQDCVIGMGTHAGQICSERATFSGFGQYVIEFTTPGPSRVGLDDSLFRRQQVITAPLAPVTDAGVSSNPSVRAGGYVAGKEVTITCDRAVHVAFGNDLAAATDADPQLAADQIISHLFTGTETSVAFQAISEPASCSVGLNAHTRINLVTKDAIPELNPDCDEADPNADRALQCKFVHGAEFDIIGHLRHVQPARPRWLILPRAADDVCCYPGPGLECPKPIKRCVTQ
ncbi:MAG: hypothetical protein U0228_20075 [Myxococcaceae bacterium]